MAPRSLFAALLVLSTVQIAECQTADHIDSYVAAKLLVLLKKDPRTTTPPPLLQGKGHVFLDPGRCVDPRLMVSMAGQESAFGTSNVATTKLNGFGYTDSSLCDPSGRHCPKKDYKDQCADSLDCSIREASDDVQAKIFKGKAPNLAELARRWCGGPNATPEDRSGEGGCDPWQKNVEAFYQAQLRIDGVNAQELQSRSQLLTYRACTGPPPPSPPCVSPGRLDFKQQKVAKAGIPSTTPVKRFRIVDCSDKSMTVTLVRTGDLSNSFSFASTQRNELTLSSKQKTTVDVAFSPSSVGEKKANVIIGGGVGKTVRLLGVGVVSQLAAPQEVVEFGQVEVGTPLERAVIISNLGDAPTGKINVLPGYDPGFRVDAMDESPIAAKGERVFHVSCSPRREGELESTLTIADSDGDRALIKLRVVGTQARLELSPSSPDFGKVRVGSSAASVDFTVTNSGTAPIRNVAVSIRSDTGDAYALQQGSFPDILPAGKQLPIKVFFKPNTEGHFTGRLAVNYLNTNDINVDLTGEGVSPLLVIQGEKSVNFGNQTRGTISKPQRVSIANDGSGDLTIVSAHVSGSGFEMARSLDGLTLPSKSKEDLEITFHPALASKYKEVLYIETDDPRGHKTLLLLGVGTHRFRVSILWSWLHRRRQQEAQRN